MSKIWIILLLAFLSAYTVSGAQTEPWYAAEAHIRAPRAVIIVKQSGVEAAARAFVSRLSMHSRVGKVVSTGKTARWSLECLYGYPYPTGPHPLPNPWPFPPRHPNQRQDSHLAAFSRLAKRIRRESEVETGTDLTQKDDKGRFASKTRPNVDRNYVFVLDTSGSISQQAFEQAKEGLVDMVEAFCPLAIGDQPSNTGRSGTKRIAVVLFSNTVRTAIAFSESSKGLEHVKRRIMGLQHKRGPATATADALSFVRRKVMPPGSANIVPHMTTDIIVITDGRCNKRCTKLAMEADNLRKAGANVYSLGIENIRRCELEIISGLGVDAAIGLEDFQQFSAFTKEMKKLADVRPNRCV